MLGEFLDGAGWLAGTIRPIHPGFTMVATKVTRLVNQFFATHGSHENAEGCALYVWGTYAMHYSLIGAIQKIDPCINFATVIFL
jgi:hypothetical protein